MEKEKTRLTRAIVFASILPPIYIYNSKIYYSCLNFLLILEFAVLAPAYYFIVIRNNADDYYMTSSKIRKKWFVITILLVMMLFVILFYISSERELLSFITICVMQLLFMQAGGHILDIFFFIINRFFPVSKQQTEKRSLKYEQ